VMLVSKNRLQLEPPDRTAAKIFLEENFGSGSIGRL